MIPQIYFRYKRKTIPLSPEPIVPVNMSNLQLAIQFFLQIAVILLACRLVGAIAARFGQPQVVAEMITGVLLGPSLFGLVAPEWQAWLFPWDTTQQSRDTSAYLFPASQLGLALYMFIVGLDGDADVELSDMKVAKEDLMIIVGSEGKGLARLTREKCDLIVSIPISSSTESLNASVATSITLFWIDEQRRKG